MTRRPAATRRRAVTRTVQQRAYGEALEYVDWTGTYSPTQLDRQGWKLRGACAGRPDFPWFDRANGAHTTTAKTLCAGCPVRRACLAAALLFAGEYGTWGGYTATDRAPLSTALIAGVPLRMVLDVALVDDTALTNHAVEAVNVA